MRSRLFLAVILVLGMAAGLFAQPEVAIYEIQGAGHISPFLDQEVTTTGVVTAIAFNGYYVQDPVGDGDEDTSDGMFVFQFGGIPAVGDLVELTDEIDEFIPGGAATGNLSTTEMSFPVVTILSSGNPLPAPVVLGKGGRIPPKRDVIGFPELPVNLQDADEDEENRFNPVRDGIDFYEALEGMLVKIQQPVAVSATRTFNPFASEMFTLVDDGRRIAPGNARTARGGINLQADPDNRGDQNPERVQIQFDGTLFPSSVPAITVGDSLGDVTGVMGYSFGNFEVNALAPFDITPSGLQQESTSLAGNDEAVTVASYNVLNLSPLSSDDNQRAALASQIVNNLASPDIVALQEIQDNNGETDDGTTDATQTLQELVDAIFAAGGPDYSFFDVAPADGTSGGIPGGNIRNAFLFNPDRVDLVSFVSLTPAVLGAAGVSDPMAFDGTRDPLAATFEFQGSELIVISNHQSSRFGSTPVFGAIQPFIQAAEDDRESQAQALNDYTDFILAQDPDAAIIIAGDFNTFEWTDDLTEILPGQKKGKKVLFNLIDELRDDNRYTFNFEGNSQVLDHMFVTRNLLNLAEFDIVHTNVDFPRVDDTVASDHEPLVARFQLGGN